MELDLVMNEAIIKAEPRLEKGTQASRRLRNKGLVLGVVYGHGQDGINVVMNGHDLVKALHTGAQLLDLKMEGQADDKVLVKEIQYDALGDDIIHVDLQRVSATETVDVTVPIVIQGHAIGAVHHGILDQPLKELRVSCPAAKIPDELRVLVTNLDIGDMITVADIELPEDVATTNSPTQVVVTMHPPVTEAEIEAEEEAVGEEEGVAVAEPEVIGGKPEEGEASEEATKEK